MSYLDHKFLFAVFFLICSDTFDENTPPIDEPEYISSLGAAIFKGMQSGDKDAIWLMQVCIFLIFVVVIVLCET